jgi:uncharacterized protein (DUF433 family)
MLIQEHAAIQRPASLIGVGIYGVAEAGRLTHVSPGRIARWLRGYVHRVGEAERVSLAVWSPQLPILDGSLALGFLDLMEVRFVDAFRRAGVPWRTIRIAAERARELIGRSHPFSTKGFKTDGRNIFAEIVRQTAERELLDLVKSQYAFARVISPSLYAGLEFNELNEASRWWPLGHERAVVIDPDYAFGQPVVAGTGIPTAAVAAIRNAENSDRATAAWFGIEVRKVRDALAFENSLAA